MMKNEIKVVKQCQKILLHNFGAESSGQGSMIFPKIQPKLAARAKVLCIIRNFRKQTKSLAAISYIYIHLSARTVSTHPAFNAHFHIITPQLLNPLISLYLSSMVCKYILVKSASILLLATAVSGRVLSENAVPNPLG